VAWKRNCSYSASAFALDVKSWYDEIYQSADQQLAAEHLHVESEQALVRRSRSWESSQFTLAKDARN
jgi:hypothetical protein